jgi:hypothetical protein
MVPQFANAQGEQKVNQQQIQALKLFFNEQNLQDTKDNQQTETLNSQSLDKSSQQGQQQVNDGPQLSSSEVQSQSVEQQQQSDNDNQGQQIIPFTAVSEEQQSTNDDNQQVETTANPQSPNVEKVQQTIQQAQAQQQVQAQQQALAQSELDAHKKHKE